MISDLLIIRIWKKLKVITSVARFFEFCVWGVHEIKIYVKKPLKFPPKNFTQQNPLCFLTCLILFSMKKLNRSHTESGNIGLFWKNTVDGNQTTPLKNDLFNCQKQHVSSGSSHCFDEPSVSTNASQCFFCCFSSSVQWQHSTRVSVI